MTEDRKMEQKDRKVLKKRLNSLSNDRKQALARYQRAMDGIGQCMEDIGGGSTRQWDRLLKWVARLDDASYELGLADCHIELLERITEDNKDERE